ncbi:uncharacterized protein LOC110440585 [Mizuhopecten yessoensis]|uniref:uncharacterized protein LOC110440585 n=1 Tax=Mizuhopecten yessoensis TaxID=6573 RepID=UPI000B45DB84|nr:uncharacterized protein LOC110440585 [Mizuhopecten yessoensis]
MMASWMSISRDNGLWYYRCSMMLEPTVPKLAYRSEVNIDVNQVIHIETIHIKCEPKIERYCRCSLASDRKITKMSQNIHYSTKFIAFKHVHVQSNKGRPIIYNNEVKVSLTCPKLTEVYHSQAIQVPPMNSQSDVNNNISVYSDDDTLSNDTIDFPQISGNPLTMSTPILGRHLSERNPRIFENDSISYLYEHDSLDSLFSKDSTMSGDDITDFQTPQFRNEVLILGLNSKKKRYANTAKLLKGILKKRPQ